MKVNKIFLVSLILLAILTLGAASAADDAADDLAVEDAGDLELEVPVNDEITTDGDVDDVAVGESSEEILGASQDERLSGPVDPSYTYNIDLPMSGTRYVAQWGQPIVVSANFTNATGNVTLTFADESYTTDLVDGAFTYTITKYKEIKNNQYLTVSYNGDENYNAVSFQNRIHIKMDDVVANGANFGQSAVANVNLYNATGNVTFTLNGVTYRKELVNGSAVQEFRNYSLGSNSVSFTYEGDGIYNPISKSLTFNIQLNDAEVTGCDFGQSAVANVNLYNATGNVTFTLNGVTYRTELVNGSAVQELKSYSLGSNSVSFAYEGDGIYNPISKSLTFTTTADIDAPTIYNFQPAIVTANLGNATGNVNFTLGDETKTVEIVNGIASFETTNYAIGDNSVAISYSGDGTFKEFSTTTKFKVLEKENATIFASVYKTSDKNMVVICIYQATGNVTAVINGKKEVLELVNGVATYNINASDVITEINVTYEGDFRFNPANTTEFAILENNIVNNENYMYYFNQANKGKLFEFIEPGTTLDFQGAIVNPDKSKFLFMDINIPVNIISTTGDGLVDLNTTARSVMGSCPDNSFVISNGGSYSNITGITFHNTQMWIANTTHVLLDNISVIIEQAIGSGVGSTSIRENTTFLTLKNSYFYTKNNGNAAAFTLSWADNCTFDNNRFIMGQGVATICLSYNTFNIPNVSPADATINSYNIFTNNYIGDENGASLRVQSQMGGVYNIFENNTFDKCDVSFSRSTGNVFIGNTISDSGSLTPGNTALVYDNLINGALSIGTESTAYNNTAFGVMTVGATSEVYNNSVSGLTLTGADALVHDNVINGITTINAATNAQIYDNTFIGDYSINFNNANANNITFSGNDVFGNIGFANQNAKNNKIVNNTITTSKDYAIDLKTFTNTENNISGNILYSKNRLGNDAVNHAEDATLILDNYPNTNATISVTIDDIKVGETAVVNVTSNETSLASADIYVNGEKYSVTLSEGKGSLELKDLLSGNYDVLVISTDKTYGAQNSTLFEVSKNDCPDILVDAPVKTQWIDSNITVTINDATGTVTLAINDSEFTEELVDGVAIFAVPDFAYGDYDFNVTYSGDYKYFGNETNGTLTVNRNKEVKIIASDIVAEKLVDKFIAKFTNYIGEGIANANVTIAIGDAIYPVVTDENGTATVDLALTRCKYGVNITFKAIEGEYDAANAEYNITVIDASLIKIISVSEEGLITAALYDALGAPIENATVATTMNETSVNLTTNDTGLFEFQAEDGCEVKFEFAGDEITTACDASITVNIKPTPKDTSIINIVSVDGTGLITGSLTVLGTPIANAIVVATMNGTSVNLLTDDAGLFNFQAKNGLETVFKYDGDFNKTEAIATITLSNVAPVVKDVSVISIVSVDGTGLITGSLTVLGAPVANATVVASVGGVDTNLTTDDAGLFVFQAVNGQEVVFKYAGNDTVESSVASFVLSNVAPVVKDVSVINVISVDGTGLIAGSLSVDGAPVANATVVASVGGVDTNLTTDDAGLFVFQAVNGQEVVFKYVGNDTVDSSVASFVLSNVAPVVKAVPVINIAAIDSTGLITGSLTLLGNPIADATVSYIINNNVTGNTTTDANGNFQVQSEFNSVIELIFAGNETVDAVNTTITLKDRTPAKLASEFNVTEGISIKTYAVDSKAGEVGQTTSFKLTDSNGNPIANATVKFAYKTVILNRTTDENGIVFIGINTQIAQEALCAMSYLGDETHNATFVAFSFDIQKKPITISAAAKSYKASAKTKKYTVTLKTEKCNSRDGKVYLSAGKKVTLKLNGKTYTAKTDKNGKATFNLKITKKGKQTAKISFTGDKTYKSASKSVKITIK